MNLLKKLESLTPEQLQNFGELTGIFRHHALDLYSAFTSWLENHMTDYLAGLSSSEIRIFYAAFKKQGVELLTLEDIPKEEASAALKQLEQKGLVYSTKSVQRIHHSIKVFLFSEIREFMEKKVRVYFYDQILSRLSFMKNASVDYQCGEMPFDLLSLFFSYFLLPRKEFVIQQFGEAAVRYFADEGLIQEALVFVVKDGVLEPYACYELNTHSLTVTPFIPARTLSYQARIFHDIIRFIYVVNRDQVLITRKGEINKKQYEKLAKEIPSENILWFLTQFLIHHRFVEIHPKRNYIYLTARGYAFFQQKIEEVYEKILDTDPFLRKVFELAEKMNTPRFGLADLLAAHFKEEGKKSPDAFLLRETRRQLLRAAEILTYLGVLVIHYNPEGYTAYSFHPRYKNLANDSGAGKKPLVLSPSMEVTVYPDDLDLQTSYRLNLFSDLEKFSDILVYRLTPESLKRALYFGLNLQDLLETLEEKSRNPVPSNMTANLKRWAEQFKSGTLQSRTLLRASKEVLDLLTHQTQYRHLILERLTETCAIVSEEIYLHRILEDSGIYLYPENRS